MRIRLIIAQYPHSYERELMPNVVDAWDEYTLDDNYAGYEEALARFRAMVEGGSFSAIREATITVPDDAILGLFKTPELPAEAVGS